MNNANTTQHADAGWSFEELYNQNFAKVNRYLRYRVINTWDADDLTTVVFMKALEKFHTYQGRSSFTAWLFSITHNVYVDYVRSDIRDDDLPVFGTQLDQQMAAGKNPEEQIVFNETVQELRGILNKLPVNYRDVMALRYAGELRYAQIAEVLGKTESAVRMLHHRALKMMCSYYEKVDDQKMGE
ncbi:MAG: sigma-70 family RNA polymerase sigma factor [Desulfotomaculum sp.]|nr:sigma-70 family RNA polymerase sigma factor [Desulfotomaculum sp.]